MTSDDTPEPITYQQLVRALDALGHHIVIDPEHGPDSLDDTHTPDLLGMLAAIVDAHISTRVGADDRDARSRYLHGYGAPARAYSDPAEAAAVLLAPLAVRILLGADTLNDSRRYVDGYARLAIPVVEFAGHTAMLAARLTDETDTVPVDDIRAHHKTLRHRLRDMRRHIDGMERLLRNQGFRI